MLPPKKLPTGIKPTFTPIRNSVSPTETYRRPMTMCSRSFFFSRRVTSWNTAMNPAMGSSALAVSFRYSGISLRYRPNISTVSLASGITAAV